MPTDTSEKQLETILVNYLRDVHHYEQGVTEDYSKDYALDTERVKRFLLSTQKQKVENTGCFASEISERKFFMELAKQLANRGVTDVLRKGFRYISELFDMYYPLPPSDEQQASVAYIEEKCQKIDKLTSELQSEIGYLKEYKQRLIADCVTGQVNVQNINI